MNVIGIVLFLTSLIISFIYYANRYLKLRKNPPKSKYNSKIKEGIDVYHRTYTHTSGVGRPKSGNAIILYLFSSSPYGYSNPLLFAITIDVLYLFLILGVFISSSITLQELDRSTFALIFLAIPLAKSMQMHWFCYDNNVKTIFSETQDKDIEQKDDTDSK